MDQTKKLVQRAQKGDVRAYEELVMLYQDRVYGLCYQLTGNYDDAQDLAQDAFIKAYGALKSFRNEADFGTWIHRITVNLWINIKRRKRHDVSLDQPVQTSDGEVQRDIAAAEDGPEEAVEKMEFQSLVRAALRDLSPEHRAVLVLREMQGYAYDEIAGVLDCSLGTVKSRINRARQALKERVKTLAAEAGMALPGYGKRNRRVK
ncbi:MAG: sigma-70 family RNA polymerase sigma factor [Peptococcaceae bacterium]|nr:sigma-70 family RNA polymerase sigma factor [Peptococcaceae bacterium]